jgi:hypothetical protein
MEEMKNFYHDKTHQVWLWRAIDHDRREGSKLSGTGGITEAA